MLRFRAVGATLGACVSCLLLGHPAALADATRGSADPVLVAHVVIPGERLREIAARYGVSPERVAADNALDPDRPHLRVGQSLVVAAREVPPPRRRLEYIVRFGDNWRTIAKRHGVSQSALRRWNRGVPRRFAAGQALTIYVDGVRPAADAAGFDVDLGTEGLPLSPIPAGGESRGEPTRGRLRDGVQLPAHPGAYRVRRPDFAWGSTHAVRHLQLALLKFRKHSEYAGELVVSDMSRRRGGAYGGHSSHQSGRDVDIWLPLRADGGAPGGDPDEPPRVPASRFDWEASWALVKALVRTGQVQYIFLSRSRQKHLYRAARAAGEDVRQLGEVIQYPRRAQTGIVRHAPHHTHHIHVRFRCGSGERRCR